jgi:hypothetical protein
MSIIDIVRENKKENALRYIMKLHTHHARILQYERRKETMDVVGAEMLKRPTTRSDS